VISFGEEQQITTADGRVWTLDKMRHRHTKAFCAWITAKIGDPFETASRFIKELPATESVRLIKEAESVRDQLRNFNALGPLGMQHLMSEDGLVFFVRQLLLRKHPGISDDEVEDVAEIVARQLVSILEKAAGTIPNALRLVDDLLAKIPGLREALWDHLFFAQNEQTGTKSTDGSGTAPPI
jgi:hypothetical protein